jgi:LmbE family N-acetylglucosaminyl deacetylase
MSLADFGVTVVLAPHPDDETLGCGATLLRLRQETSSTLHWILMTRMSEAAGYDAGAIAARDREIEAVSKRYGFTERVQLPFGAATLDSEPTAALVQAMAGAFDRLKPETLLMPFPADAHSDHARTFKIGSACAKWFRRTHLRRIMCYEVVSETGFNLDPTRAAFEPNCYVKVPADLIEQKIAIMANYATEMAPYPFPRSAEAIRALSQVRGSECGAPAAEAFVLVRDIC